MEKSQNVGTKSAFTPYINLCIITKLYLNTLWFGELHTILEWS